MEFPDAVVDELAQVWARLHGSAARVHLHHMIGQMRRLGDGHGAANYRRILAVLRKENKVNRKGVLGGASRGLRRATRR
jgi:hypothetical protein